MDVEVDVWLGAVEMRARRYIQRFNEVSSHLYIDDRGTHLVYNRHGRSSRTSTR